MDFAELRELYQEMILDHGRRPRNFGRLTSANHTAEGHNPVCGDQVALYLRVEDGKIADASFEGKGCAISTASASLLTTEVKGRSVAEANELFRNFHLMVTGGREGPPDIEALGKLAIFQGVREFPIRVKCASLPWHTLRAALEGKKEKVSTE